MIEVADGVWRFEFAWKYAFNAYYIEHPEGGVVVDASTRWDTRTMVKQLKGRNPKWLVITHAHPDHQGCAAKLCKQFGLTMAAHELEVDALEGRKRLVRHSFFWEMMGNIFWAGPRGKVGRVLKEGDEVAGFQVLHMPGHTPGQIVLWREKDGLAIAGDVANNGRWLLPAVEKFREPPRAFTADAEENRRSIGKLARLRPRMILFGHGPAMRGCSALARYRRKWRSNW